MTLGLRASRNLPATKPRQAEEPEGPAGVATFHLWEHL